LKLFFHFIIVKNISSNLNGFINRSIGFQLLDGDSRSFDVKQRDFKDNLRTMFQIFSKDKIFKTNRILTSKKVFVGRNSFYNENFKVLGDQFVRIGSFCSFGRNVTVITVNHDYNFTSSQGYLYRKYFNSPHPGEAMVHPTKVRTRGPVEIGDDVWIGDNVIITSGVQIGPGACVAAGSVITKNVNPYEIVGGVPARHIKYRFDSAVISKMLASKWWEWSDKKIKESYKFFYRNWNSF